MCHVACFCQSHWQGCVKWRQGANSVAGVAFCAMCWKLTEASHETSILNFQVLRKTRRKTSILKLQYEMLVFLHPRVLSRVAGFPVASPCLWVKLKNISYSNVSKQVVMSFCVAGVALCDIPTCLITCRKYQNWRMSRTKCAFFLHPRVSSRVSGLPHSTHHTLHFPLQTPHSTLYTLPSTLHTLNSTLYTPRFPHFQEHVCVECFDISDWPRVQKAAASNKRPCDTPIDMS